MIVKDMFCVRILGDNEIGLPENIVAHGDAVESMVGLNLGYN